MRMRPFWSRAVVFNSMREEVFDFSSSYHLGFYALGSCRIGVNGSGGSTVRWNYQIDCIACNYSKVFFVLHDALFVLFAWALVCHVRDYWFFVECCGSLFPLDSL